MSTEDLLGFATTGQLIKELAARASVAAAVGEAWPQYRTVGGGRRLADEQDALSAEVFNGVDADAEDKGAAAEAIQEVFGYPPEPTGGTTP